MPTSVVSQLPADIEAPPPAATDADQREEEAPPAAAGAEVETEPAEGDGGVASTVTSGVENLRRQGSDFPLFTLGFAAVVRATTI